MDGLNLYVYVGNNPASWVDPYGLYTIPWETAFEIAFPQLLSPSTVLKGVLNGVGGAVVGVLADASYAGESGQEMREFEEQIRRAAEMAAAEPLPPLPGTPIGTESGPVTEVLDLPDISEFLGPLITPDDFDICWLDPEIYPWLQPEKGDNVIADPIQEEAGPQIMVSEGNEDLDDWMKEILGQNSEGINETYKTLKAATGQVNELINVDTLKTKHPFWRKHGYTKKVIGQNPDTGEWYSAFYNPSTGEYSGGKPSSRW